MKKYIHYCWFGDKPFPKLGQNVWKAGKGIYQIMK